MIYLPPIRRFLLPTLIFVTVIILNRTLPTSSKFASFIIHNPPAPTAGIRVPISDLQNPLPIAKTASENHLPPPNHYYYSYDKTEKPLSLNNTGKNSSTRLPLTDGHLKPLFTCTGEPNRYTGHLRMQNIVQNVSQIPPIQSKPDIRGFWNPTIIALPYWSKNQYLIVSRILTDGNHQENVLCEANVCYVPGQEPRPGEKPCTEADLQHLGPSGGMRCANPPVTLSVPPTPAEHCEGKFQFYVDIPGFHDPRIFWSGKGEPLMMVNTQSRYACFGLWIIDLRSLHPSLEHLLSSSPTMPSLGPLKSYPSLTELTRNPASTRSQIEKNWFLFFTSNGESYIHYDLPMSNGGNRGRTFAKVLGNGLTTTNLTDPLEQSCLDYLVPFEKPKPKEKRDRRNPKKLHGTWHQATNALRLILCNRSDPTCKATSQNTVFFTIAQRKFENELGLPMRYERFFMVWEATPPFSNIGISQHPILMANETTSGFPPSQMWADDAQNNEIVEYTKKMDRNATEPFGGKDKWAYFTYTVSMAYAWGRPPRRGTAGDEAQDMHVGYLDDEVILGIGVDDMAQAFSRVKAGELVQCLRACPGRGEN